MDDIVKQGMAKWPNVPSVFGWLGLDRRGHWLIKGERISNTLVADFIGRNYERDEQGRWFFQNGPQRVFISLDYTPFIYRLLWEPAAGAAQRIETHTGRAVTQIDGAWIDDAGIVLLESEHGVGLVDDRDLERLLIFFSGTGDEALDEEYIAAAIEQLGVWAKRAGAEFVARRQGGDAAGLAFEALETARANGSDVLIIDTAGRLQNKAGLMAELEKIARVIKKLDPSSPHAALLVLDATTGQNAISQVEAFTASVPLTGLIMTKLDGTAKGGILVALAARFGLPVHYLGIGESEDDLQAFDAGAFARALAGVQ